MSEADDAYFIDAGELAARLGEQGLTIVDGSWYLPAMNRDAKAEFAARRIPGAVYFDIDAIADTQSPLPHMLPDAKSFGEAAGRLGLDLADEIVVYDGPGMFSVARVWWALRVMGSAKVRILAGGFDGWKAAGLPVAEGAPVIPRPRTFTADFDAGRVRDYDAMLANIRRGTSLVLDARPFARFTGEAPEPRPGLAGGHIPGSRSLPATDLVRDGRLLPRDALMHKLRAVAAHKAAHVTTSCGSGVTAAILSLALDICGHDNHALYDGSWAEWGGRGDAPIARWV